MVAILSWIAGPLFVPALFFVAIIGYLVITGKISGSTLQLLETVGGVAGRQMRAQLQHVMGRDKKNDHVKNE